MIFNFFFFQFLLYYHFCFLHLFSNPSILHIKTKETTHNMSMIHNLIVIIAVLFKSKANDNELKIKWPAGIRKSKTSND